MVDDLINRFCHGDLRAAADFALQLHLMAEPGAAWWEAGCEACLQTSARRLLDEGLNERGASAVVAAVHGWAQGIYGALCAKLRACETPRVVVTKQGEHRFLSSGDFAFCDEALERELGRLPRFLFDGRRDECFRACARILEYVQLRYLEKSEERRPALLALVRELRWRAPRVDEVEAALAVLDPDGPPSPNHWPEPRWRGRAFDLAIEDEPYTRPQLRRGREW